MNKFLYGSLVVLFLLVGGCSTSGGIYDEENGPTGANAGEDNGVDVMALDEDCKPPCAFPRAALEDSASILANRLIFFDYDSAEIKPKYQDLIVAHGKYLASYPDVKIRLEGHTDERGSREYNLALGEERAKSVRRLLLLQGVADGNISIVSFGEELPLDLGHDESAWQQNRRVEIVYEEH